MGKVRDYRAEYQHRVASAAKRGLSRSQARGHARSGEAPIRKPKAADNAQLEAALKQYLRIGNQANAAKKVGISPERLRRFLRENVQVEGYGRSRKFTDTGLCWMRVMSDGHFKWWQLRRSIQASLNGEHLNAVGRFLSSNDPDFLRPFVGRVVIDAKGRAHLLETDPNALYRLAAAGSELFHDVYRLVI